MTTVIYTISTVAGMGRLNKFRMVKYIYASVNEEKYLLF